MRPGRRANRRVGETLSAATSIATTATTTQASTVHGQTDPGSVGAGPDGKARATVIAAHRQQSVARPIQIAQQTSSLRARIKVAEALRVGRERAVQRSAAAHAIGQQYEVTIPFGIDPERGSGEADVAES